jgi:hypothetical protein
LSHSTDLKRKGKIKIELVIVQIEIHKPRIEILKPTSKSPTQNRDPVTSNQQSDFPPFRFEGRPSGHTPADWVSFAFEWTGK